MRRRDFITMLGSGAIAWPFAARAQQRNKLARIGFLGGTSASGWANQVDGFRTGLRDLGYTEGNNVIIEYRWAEGQYDRLPDLVAELVRLNADVIVTHGTPGSVAAKKATTSIPIVVALTGDMVAAGIVTNLTRPDGNITGQSFLAPELNGKRIELLKELAPQMNRVAAIFNPNNASSSGPELQGMVTAAQALKIDLQSFPVRGPNDFESAFKSMETGQAEAVAINDDGMINANIKAIVMLVNKHRLLSVGNAAFAEVGGLMGYGVDYFAAYRRAAVFVDKILKGSKPADIPVEQATKFDFVINFKTAKVLGLSVPDQSLVRATKVIE
jgi:putative ABC transport system substrate-binding protein